MQPRRKQVGDYVLVDQLGEGNRSTVRLGYHVPTEEKVAVKVYDKTANNTPGQWKVMRAEVRRLSRLQHPNLVQLLEAMESEHGYYLVFEHVDGGNVDQLALSRFNIDFVRRLFIQMLEALRYLHSQGLMFGHLKLSSCLLDRSQTLKIKGLHRCSSLEPVGDYPVRLVDQIKRAVDVWSLGAVLLRLVTHRVQPTSPNEGLQQRSLSGTDFFIPASVSKDLEDLLRRMLDLNPVTRITVADLYRHPWLQPAIPSSAFPTSPQRPLAQDIVKEVAQRYSVSEEEVRASIIGHKADNLAAMYLLLRRRLLSGRGLPPQSPLPTPPPVAPAPPVVVEASPVSSVETEPRPTSLPDFRACLHQLREKARQQRLLSSASRPGQAMSPAHAPSERSIVLSRLNSGLESTSPDSAAITLPSAFTTPTDGLNSRMATSCALCRAHSDTKMDRVQLAQRQRRAALRLASQNPADVYNSLSRRYGTRFVKDVTKARAMEMYSRQLGVMMSESSEKQEGKKEVSDLSRTPPPPPNSRLQTRASQRSSAKSLLERVNTTQSAYGFGSIPTSSRSTVSRGSDCQTQRFSRQLLALQSQRRLFSAPTLNDPAKSTFGSQLKSTRPRREYTGISSTRTFQWTHHQAVNVI